MKPAKVKLKLPKLSQKIKYNDSGRLKIAGGKWPKKTKVKFFGR